MGKLRKKIIFVIFLLFMLVGLIYGGGVYYFSLHFLPGTVINSMDCSFMTLSQTQDVMKEQAKEYLLVLDERNNGREVLRAEQMGVCYRTENRIEEFMKKQQKWRWFLELRNTYILDKTACIEYDEDLLEKSVGELRCMQEEEITPAKNASVRRNGNQFVSLSCVEGDQIKEEKLFEVIDKAILSGKTVIDLEKMGCYETPSVRETDEIFLESLDKANQMMKTILTYDFGNNTERVDADMVAQWLVWDETGAVSLEREKVRDYVLKLAEKYDGGGGELTFHTYDARTITVSAKNMVWEMDREAETEALFRDIEQGSITVREPIYRRRGLNRKQGNVGETYIEVDLGNQRMLAYKDGELLLDTSIISGNPREGWETSTGCFPIGEKKRGIFLEGGVRQVQYWIPFTEQLGILDAPWREEFGGDLYTLIGTEGNIESPLDAARVLYENMTEGDPVVIYN